MDRAASSRPLPGPEALKDFKFRSAVWKQKSSKLGAKPIVMDFAEIFTALKQVSMAQMRLA